MKKIATVLLICFIGCSCVTIGKLKGNLDVNEKPSTECTGVQIDYQTIKSVIKFLCNLPKAKEN